MFSKTNVLFLAASIGSLTFSSIADEPSLSINLATCFKPGHILHDGSLKFKEIIESRSNGRITVGIDAGRLTEEQLNLDCAGGKVDIQATGGKALEDFCPQYFFVNTPFVVKDYNHFLRIWNGRLGKEASAQMLQNGNMYTIGTLYRGLRHMTSNKPINNSSDIIGLRLRLPVIAVWIEVWQAFGAEALPFTLPELYQVLADGRADASEGDLSQITSVKLYEVQKYLSLTGHFVNPGYMFANRNFMDGLSENDKVLVKDAMKEACEWAVLKFKTDESNLLKVLEQKGMIIVHTDVNPIKERIKPVIEDMFRRYWPVTTWEEVMEYANPSVEVYSYDEGSHEQNIVKPRMYLVNKSKELISGVTFRYFLAPYQGKMPVVDAYYVPGGTTSCKKYNESLSWVDYSFPSAVILPGSAFPDNSGLVSGIHYADWSIFDKSNDPSTPQPKPFSLNGKVAVYSNGVLITTNESEAPINP